MKDNAANMLAAGLAAGAAAGALGVFWMTRSGHDRRQLRRHTRDMTRSAEKALGELEEMICRCKG